MIKVSALDNNRETVLVVEDEAAMRKMAGLMLSHMDYTVLAAKDGIDAVDVLRRHKDEISCVLCDLTMPGMDGWETLSAMREISPDIPVILTSGHDKSLAMAGRNQFESPHTFLSKPYLLKELGEAVRSATAKKSGLCTMI